MEKMFCLGVILGAVSGALLVANSYKMRSLVKKSQAEFVDKVNEMMDERLGASNEKNSSEKKETPSEPTEKKGKK